MGQRKDISGERFGKLVALKWVGSDSKRSAVWLCKCDCGKFVNRRLSDLRHGHTVSCGCLKCGKLKKHGKSAGGKNYERWKSMKKRCFNPNDHYYYRYGGRGITVCEAWKDDFTAYDDYISKLPHANEPGYTIDRIDNNGNYEPGNVRWATGKEQGKNRG